eukprot:8269961-Pyramimonas_sp.AAC.1
MQGTHCGNIWTVRGRPASTPHRILSRTAGTPFYYPLCAGRPPLSKHNIWTVRGRPMLTLHWFLTGAAAVTSECSRCADPSLSTHSAKYTVWQKLVHAREPRDHFALGFDRGVGRGAALD